MLYILFCWDISPRPKKFPSVKYVQMKLRETRSVDNIGKTVSMSMLTLFESRYTLKGRYNIGNVGKNCFYEYAYSL